MIKKLTLFVILLGLGILGQDAGSGPEDPSLLEYEISIDGPALFYRVKGDSREALWRVDCTLPLRNCVARAHGLVLRIDNNRRGWLIAAKPSSSRLSIQRRNFSEDAGHILSQPISLHDIEKLSDQDSFLVIENNGMVLLRTRTQALDKLISYLTWVNSPKARMLNDARLWADTASLSLDNAKITPNVLSRYQTLQSKAHSLAPIQVPRTKPQIEFAINAQSGSSFYSATGDSGY